MKRKNGKIKSVKLAKRAVWLLAAGIGCVQAGCGGGSVQELPVQETLLQETDGGEWKQEEACGQAETAGGRAEDGTEGSTEGSTKEKGREGDEETGQEKTVEKSAEQRRSVPVGSLELVPAEPVVREQEEEEDTVVSIGSLEIILPLGWKMEERVSGDGIKQYVLEDVHSDFEGEEIEGHKDGYEHEIVITPYQIGRMPELYHQLAAEIQVYFAVPLLYGMKVEAVDGRMGEGEMKGCWMFGEDREVCDDVYFLFSENGTGGTELFHVREGDGYITANLNAAESFEELMESGLVRTDGGEYTVQRYGTKRMEAYFLLNKNTDHTLFMAVQEDTGEAVLYRMVDWTEAGTQKLGKYFRSWSMAVTDLNQDGYEDMLCSYWLLDSRWTLDSVSEDKFEGYLWDVRSGTFVFLEGREILKRYGAVWEGRWGEEKSGQGEEQIPESLVEAISEYMERDREELRDMVLALVTDRELTMEEVKELAKENRGIKNEMLVIASNAQGAGVWLKVDADNDGIEDVFLCESLGGSLGEVFYCLFAGTGDGQFRTAGWWEGAKEEFTFIRWEGKNYLVKTTWDFGKKCVDGISLEYFENGMQQGGVWIAVTAREGESSRSIVTSRLADETYRELASGLEEFSKSYESGEKVPQGTAEEEGTVSGCNRRCDMDNDGVMEEYYVSRFQSVNYYTVDCLYWRAEEDEMTARIFDMMEEDGVEGTPMNLWVDKTEYGNVVYILYEEGLYDFHICGYLLSENWQKLVQTDCQVRTEVTPQKIKKSNGVIMH